MSAAWWIEAPEGEESRLLNLAVSASRHGIIITDPKLPDDPIVYANPAFEELTGYASGEILGKNCRFLQGDDRDQAALKEIRYALGEGRGCRVTVQNYKKDGTPFLNDLSISPVRDADGRLLNFVGVQEDVTERERTQDALRRVEDEYHSILENSVEGIFRTTLDGHPLTTNPAMARIFGYDSPEEMMDRVMDMTEQIYEDPRRRQELTRLLEQQGAVSGFEIQARRKDGGLVWISMNARALREDGRVIGFQGTVEDISERKEFEKTLREVREAERARIARDIHDEALQDIVHALQQIETGKVLGQEGKNAVNLEEVSAALKRSIEGLRSAIYDLRLEGHGEKSFPEMLASLVQMNRRRSPERAFRLSIQEGVVPLPLDKDGQVELLRIMQEALTNVRRHSRATTVSVTLEASGNSLRAEVSDDGRGFDPSGGSGMGTRTMRERSRALGGELKVESQPGRGTTVSFEMATLEGDGEEEDAARILLVEDHASFRQAAASVLDLAPEIEVVGQAGSLEEAREMLGAKPIDVAIVDLGLPDGYGAELIKELRDANPEAQALVLSASLDRAEIARAVEYGAAGVLHKSASMSEVVDAVRRLRVGETLLPLSEVVELLRYAGTRRKEEHEARYALAQLTPREHEVLQSLARGLDGREIAEKLHISVTTERNHTARILSKLGVHSRLQALVFALRYGAVEIS